MKVENSFADVLSNLNGMVNMFNFEPADPARDIASAFGNYQVWFLLPAFIASVVNM